MLSDLARVRALLEFTIGMRGTPGVNMEFAIAVYRQALARAEAAAISGDVVETIAAYQQLKECE